MIDVQLDLLWALIARQGDKQNPIDCRAIHAHNKSNSNAYVFSLKNQRMIKNASL